MQNLVWKKHPFRLLFYLELILLGIAVVAVLSPPMPHKFLRPWVETMMIFRPTVIFVLGLLAIMGLRSPLQSPNAPSPFGSRFFQGLYTAVGFGFSWLVILFAGKGIVVFPPLLLVVVIRGCLMFSWRGRVLTALFAYVSFIAMLIMSFLGIKPLGIPLGKPVIKRLLRTNSEEVAQTVLIHLTFNAALLFGLVLIFVLLLVGALLSEKQSRQELVSANKRLRQYALLIENQATLQERTRIAREMHDSVGHSLTAQSIQLENVAMFLRNNLEQASEHLQNARKLGKEALQNVRQSVATLRTHPLQGKKLDEAIAQLIEDICRNTGISIESEIYLYSSPTDEIATAIYRVVQEAFTNISKHSGAEKVRLRLKESMTDILLQIADNGQGFDPMENTTGFGLKGMRERVEALGGKFYLTSNPGKGCKIQIEIPR
ncbi:MAG: sensor histidine kinase [Cyanobacteria bacterium P01_A01_bin.84]